MALVFTPIENVKNGISVTKYSSEIAIICLGIDGEVFLDNTDCEPYALTIADQEQILSKMKELQSNSQNSPSDADLSCQDELGYTRDDEDWFFDDKDD